MSAEGLDHAGESRAPVRVSLRERPGCLAAVGFQGRGWPVVGGTQIMIVAARGGARRGRRRWTAARAGLERRVVGAPQSKPASGAAKTLADAPR